MTELSPIPSYALFGETTGFPDVLHCERIKDRAPDHAWHIAPHRHAQLAQVLYILSGGGTANIDGDRFALTQGSVVFIQDAPLSVVRQTPPVTPPASIVLSS